MVSSHLFVALTPRRLGAQAPPHDECVFSIPSLHVDDGALQFPFPGLCLDVGEEVDGGQLLGEQVAKADVQPLDGAARVDRLGEQALEVFLKLAARVRSLLQLALLARVRVCAPPAGRSVPCSPVNAPARRAPSA